MTNKLSKAEQIVKILNDAGEKNVLSANINEDWISGDTLVQMEQEAENCMGDSWTHLSSGASFNDDDDIYYDEDDDAIYIGHVSVDYDDYPDEDEEYESDYSDYPQEGSDGDDIKIYLEDMDEELVNKIKKLVA
jgi:hypothetical protein